MEAGTIVLVIVGVVLSGALVFIGYLMAGGASGAQSDVAQKPAPQNCAQFCMAWQSSRMDVCTASTELIAARAWYNTVATNLAGAAAAFAVALAAAFAAPALIPLLGPAIGMVLIGAAATALAVVVTLTGVLAGASAMVLQKQGKFIGALDAETKARQAVRDNCTSAEVATCFAMPAPC
jgi:hypothetical protein